MANQSKLAVTLGGLLVLSVMGNCWQFFSSLDSNTQSSVNNERPARLVTERASLLQSAMVWLQRGNFDQAIAAMESLRANSSSQAAELQINWLQELYSRLENEQLAFVQSALTALLEAYPYNEDYLLLQANLLERSGEDQLASAAFYELADQPSLSEDDNLIANARRLALRAVDSYQAQQQWQPALDFLDQLLWREPGYPPYTLALVKAHLSLGNQTQAQLYLDRLDSNGEYSQQIRQLAQMLEQSGQPTATQLALTSQGNHLLAPLAVGPGDDLQLMIDTGASLSVISSERISAMPQARFVRSVTMNTAGGQVQADVYQFAQVQLGPYRLSEVEFAALPLANLSGDGLLGMNILQRFSFNIDTDAKTLGLTLK